MCPRRCTGWSRATWRSACRARPRRPRRCSATTSRAAAGHRTAPSWSPAKGPRRRTIGADGRGRAFVNDQPASVALLRRLGDTLVEIQGQMEQHGLLDVATHRASLDAFAGLDKQADGVRTAWQAWKAAERARAE